MALRTPPMFSHSKSKPAQDILEEGLKKREALKSKQKEGEKRKRESQSQRDQVSNPIGEAEPNRTQPAQNQRQKQSKKSQNNTASSSMATSTPPIRPPPKLKSAEETYGGGSQIQEVRVVKAKELKDKKKKKKKRQDGSNKAVFGDESQSQMQSTQSQCPDIGSDNAPKIKEHKKEQRKSRGDEPNPTAVEGKSQSPTHSTQSQKTGIGADIVPTAFKSSKTKRKRKSGDEDAEKHKDGHVEDCGQSLENGADGEAAAPKNKKRKKTKEDTLSKAVPNVKILTLAEVKKEAETNALDLNIALSALRKQENAKRRARKAERRASEKEEAEKNALWAAAKNKVDNTQKEKAAIRDSRDPRLVSFVHVHSKPFNAPLGCTESPVLSPPIAAKTESGAIGLDIIDSESESRAAQKKREVEINAAREALKRQYAEKDQALSPDPLIIKEQQLVRTAKDKAHGEEVSPGIDMSIVNERRAAKKAKRKAELEVRRKDAEISESRIQFGASPEHLDLEALGNNQGITDFQISKRTIFKLPGGRVASPDPKIKADLLLQTILKGRKNVDVANSEPITQAGAIAENNSSGTPAISSTKLVPVKQPKSKKLRKSQSKKTKVESTDTGNQPPLPQESLSQTIESIKLSSTSKLQNIFSQARPTPPENYDFFDDEPLAVKRDRMLIAAAWSPLKPTRPAHEVVIASGTASLKNPLAKRERMHAAAAAWSPTKSPLFARHFPPYPDTAAAKSPIAERRHARVALLEGWEKSSGKIRGIVATNTDELPEENIAFSSTYISDRPQGVHIGDSSFNIVSIDSGKEHKFGVDKHFGLRVCSVVSGRVEVTLGKMDFDIGENGMWRIKNKEHCVVKNLAKVVAVLHITSMP